MHRFFHFLLIALFPTARGTAQDTTRIDWGPPVIINNIPVVKPAPATGRHGNYGSEHVRLLHLRDGAWLAGHTVSVNKEYDVNESYGPASTGGLGLEISLVQILWGSLYQIEPGRIISASSIPRDEGGHEVGLKMGSLNARPKSH